MKKKLLATMAAIPLLGAFGGTGVLAATPKIVTNAEQIQGDTSQPSTIDKDVEVKINQDSTFSVIIPKEIQLLKDSATTDTYRSDYFVIINGNIAGNEYIEVTPKHVNGTQTGANGATVDITMSQGNKASLTAKLTQTETTASSSDLLNNQYKVLQGKITVDGVTAGNWSGNFKFDINLKK